MGGLSHRKCTVAGSFVGGVVDAEEVNVTLATGSGGGIVGKDFDNKMVKDKGKVETRRTVSINTTFREFNVPKVIDYLSLDVEGAEFLVMEHFPFETYVMWFMTVERPNKELHELFIARG